MRDWRRWPTSSAPSGARSRCSPPTSRTAHDVDRVAARLEDPARPIDILVNNAGFGMHMPLTAPTSTALDRGFEVMCRAVLVLSGAAARAMRDRGYGPDHQRLVARRACSPWAPTRRSRRGSRRSPRGSRSSCGARASPSRRSCPGWVRTEFHERAAIKTSSIPNSLWLDAEQLVTACLRDVDRGRVISIPTVRYKVLVGLLATHRGAPCEASPARSRRAERNRWRHERGGSAERTPERGPDRGRSSRWAQRRADARPRLHPRSPRRAGSPTPRPTSRTPRRHRRRRPRPLQLRVHATARFVAQRWVMKPTIWSITHVTVIGREKLNELDGRVRRSSRTTRATSMRRSSSARCPAGSSRYLATGAAADYFFDVWWRRGLTSLFFNAFPIQRGGTRAPEEARLAESEPAVSAASLLAAGLPGSGLPRGHPVERRRDGHLQARRRRARGILRRAHRSAGADRRQYRPPRGAALAASRAATRSASPSASRMRPARARPPSRSRTRLRDEILRLRDPVLGRYPGSVRTVQRSPPVSDLKPKTTAGAATGPTSST